MDSNLAKLRQLAISDAGFVFDPMTGHTFSINATGRVVLSLLKEGYDAAGIAARLTDDFELEGGEDVRRDVDDFLARLREHALTE